MKGFFFSFFIQIVYYYVCFFFSPLSLETFFIQVLKIFIYTYFFFLFFVSYKLIINHEQKAHVHIFYCL